MRITELSLSLHRTWVPFTHFYSNSLAQELAYAPRGGARLLRQPRAAALNAVAPSWVPVAHCYCYCASFNAGARCGAALT